jgi:hypothetical protein
MVMKVEAVALFMYQRFYRPSRGYRVCVTMHDLPGVVFGSEDRRTPQIEWDDILPSANLALAPLYPHNVGKLSSYVLRHGLKASDLAISEIRCGTLHSGTNLLPSTCGRGNRVMEAYVFSMGEHHLHGFRVPFDELTQRELTLFNHSVKIIYRSHLEITSIVGTSSFLPLPRGGEPALPTSAHDASRGASV